MKLHRALITGPTGAIGTALIDELVSRGVEVLAVCRGASSRRDAIPAHPLVTVLDCDLERLKTLGWGKEPPCDAFFHLAWAGVYGEDRNDLLRQSENIRYTLDAVELSSRLGCKVFVGAGSQSEFGHVEGCLRPDLPTNPDNGYGAAKLAAGHFSRIRCRQLGVRHQWCRILSVYGPRDGDYTLMMSSIRRLLRGERPALTKGDQIWDFLYSRDAARALRSVAEKGTDGQCYVLGSGQTRPLRAFLEAVRDAVDPEAALGFGELPYYPNQVMHLEADISRLTADTGFTPAYSFEQGIAETVAWARKSMMI